MSDIEHIDQLMIIEPIHQSGQQPVSSQGRGTVGNQRKCLRPFTFGKCIDPLGKLVSSRFRWNIGACSEPDPA
jgi:hypothetical protein